MTIQDSFSSSDECTSILFCVESELNQEYTLSSITDLINEKDYHQNSASRPDATQSAASLTVSEQDLCSESLSQFSSEIFPPSQMPEKSKIQVHKSLMNQIPKG